MDFAAQDYDISATESMDTDTCCVENNKETTDPYKIYTHDLQMYRNLPTGQISLAEFENIAVERLKVLRTIDCLSKIIEIKPDEYKDCLLNALKSKELNFYAALINKPGCDSHTLEDIEARKRDHISHFVLRLSLCKETKTLDWFLKQEEMLLKLRFTSLNKNGLEKFLAINDFNFPTLTDEEKHENRENLVAVYEDIDVDNTVFYKVNYLRLRYLVRTRKTFMKRGIAFVPSKYMIYVITQTFKENLRQDVKRTMSLITNDIRLEPIFKNFFTFTEKMLLYEENSINPNSLDEFALTSFPLCMKTMHEALRKNHHLKNQGRFQYGLFLKLIGLSYEGSVDFWKQEFLQYMNIQTFEKDYLYNIKHMYGRVGRRMKYQSLHCKSVIGQRVGFGEYHGCPYKNMTKDTLHSSMKQFGLEEEGIAEIEDLVECERYMEACSKCFHLRNKNDLEDIISSPANYFFASQELIKRKERIKEQEKKYLHGKEEDDNEISYLNTTGGNVMELSNWNIEVGDK